MASKKRGEIAKQRWKGKPWEQQNHLLMKETDTQYQAFKLYFSGVPLLQIPNKMKIARSSVEQYRKVNQWLHRVRSFDQFPEAPQFHYPDTQDSLPEPSKEQVDIRLEAEVELQQQKLEKATEQRINAVEKELAILEKIGTQVEIMEDQYRKASDLNDKLWKGVQIGVDALLADEDKLKSMSITEIQKLQSVAVDISNYQLKLSSDTSGLSRLAEYVTKQLESKRRKKARRN